MDSKTKSQLLANGYSVNDAEGTIECANPKRPHSHVAVVRIYPTAKADRDHAEAVLAVALREAPHALVSRHSDGHITAVYRCDMPGDIRYGAAGIEPTGGAHREFAGLTVVIGSAGRNVDVDGTVKWDGGRSPLNTSRDSLPWIYADQSTSIMQSARDICGDVVTPSPFEIAVAARKSRIASGIEPQPVAAVDDQAAADDALVAGAHPTLTAANSGLFGGLVAAARTRIANRKASAEA